MKQPIIRRMLAALAACVCLLLTGCGNDEGILRYDIANEPVNLDPQSSDDPASTIIIENTFEGLLRVAPDGKLTEGVAKDYTVSEDGLVYLFQLRTDAKWRLGQKGESRPVTAQDFVFAFQRLFTPDTRAPDADQFYCIKNAQRIHKGELDPSEVGVTAPDDYTVRIELEYPNSQLPSLLTTPAAMPCNEQFFHDSKGRYGLESDAILSNGSFYVRKWTHDDFVSLVWNEAYWNCENITVNGVTLYIGEREKFGEPQTAVERFLGGSTDCIAVSGSQLDAFLDKGYNSDSYETVTWGLAFNLAPDEQGQPRIFADANLRRALACAWSYDSYQHSLGRGYSLPIGIVPDVTVLDASYREVAGSCLPYPLDLEQADSYMEQAYASSSSLKQAVILVPDGYGLETFVASASQIWQKELNVYAGIEVLEEDAFQQRLESGEYDCAIMPLTGAYNSPYAYLSNFKQDASWNTFGYADPQFEALLEQAVREKDLADSVELYRQAEQRLSEAAVFLPIANQKEYFFMSSSVSGLVFNPFSRSIQFSTGRIKD